MNDPTLPPDQQRVALRAKIASGDDQIWWFVDGNCLGSCHDGEVMWWNPIAGPHEIRVTNAQGDASTAKITVLGPR